MVVEPQTNIYILRGVNLDTSYKNTLYFSSEAEQATFFKSKEAAFRPNCTYQRQTQKCFLEVGRDAIYDCNYMMFQNSAFSNKWFYAFIIDIEYRNNETSVITFQIDIMQTWFFTGMQIKPCFIERMHAPTDALFSNLVTDTQPIGETVAQSMNQRIFSDWKIAIISSRGTGGTQARGRIMNGVFNGFYFATFPSTVNGIQDATNYVQLIEDDEKAQLLSVYMYPAEGGDGEISDAKQIIYSFNNSFTDINGYTPRNKKLFTYPYNYLSITNLNGQTINLRYEYFSNPGTTTFHIYVVIFPEPKIMLVPTNYRGMDIAWDYSLTISSFPQCGVSADTFANQMRANAGKTTAAAIGLAISTIATVATGGAAAPALAAAGVATVQQAGTIFDASRQPPNTYGGLSGGDMALAIGNVGFKFYNCGVNLQDAIILDDMWSMYGYPINQVITPNLAARPAFTYIKTKGAKATGNCPADDAAKINSIFDAGIWVWKNNDYVGNFQTINS